MSAIRGEFIENVTLAGSNASDAAPIPHHPGVTYVNLASGGVDSGVILSSSCKPSDSVVCFFDASVGTMFFYPPAGQSFQAPYGASLGTHSNPIFVMLSATEWGIKQ